MSRRSLRGALQPGILATFFNTLLRIRYIELLRRPSTASRARSLLAYLDDMSCRSLRGAL
jgi:hypothetical protein